MPFETALSGIRAASTDLRVTGNNIANVSTTGFKESRVEFGDVYATSVLGGGSNAIGSGVQIRSVSQSFDQGSIAFTEKQLDLAINGSGFFVLENNGEQSYTRAGAFALDRDGFVVNSDNGRLQGFPANSSGNIDNSLPSDIVIQTDNLSPRATTSIDAVYNLNASDDVLQSSGSSISTTGNVIGVAQSGLQDALTTTLQSNNFTLPLANNFNLTPITFDVELTAASQNQGTVSLNLNTAAGVPATITNFNELSTLAGVINSQLSSPVAPQTRINVTATAIDLGAGNYRLDFTQAESGEASQIRVLNGSASIANLGLPVGPLTATSTPGVPAVDNGYPQQSIEITDNEGDVITFTSLKGATAAATASQLNALTGINANATTSLTLASTNFVNNTGNLIINLNGVNLTTDNLVALESEINDLTTSTLPGISARIDQATGDLEVTSSVGDDLVISISSTDDGDSLTVRGSKEGSQDRILEVNTPLGNPNGVTGGAIVADGNSIVVGGSIDLTLEEGITFSNPTPVTGLFGPLTEAAYTPVILNAFNPADQTTYNSASSATIYDSLGNSHIQTQYFVKQDYDPEDPLTSPNHWKLYIQVDGEDVGDPDTTLPPPANTVPTRAEYDVFFNEDGSLNNLLTGDILVSNWDPVGEDGLPNGALRPLNVLAGATSLIPDPPTSSNFIVNLDGTTQFGSDFAVTDIDQSGFATGRLSGLNVDDTGIIFARFTNGESQVLGQVALADFSNPEGLQPSGNTAWVENFKSGPPKISAPQSGSLGALQSGALEGSNVDLSDELVNLIIAQRNFQASAKTIETADTVTQTIINLR